MTLNSFWKDIWHLQIPSRMRIFLWCAYSNTLPLKATLVNKVLSMDTKCEYVVT